MHLHWSYKVCAIYPSLNAQICLPVQERRVNYLWCDVTACGDNYSNTVYFHSLILAFLLPPNVKFRWCKVRWSWWPNHWSLAVQPALSDCMAIRCLFPVVSDVRRRSVPFSLTRRPPFTPQEDSVRGFVDPRATVRLEGLGQLRSPMTWTGIEPATCGGFQFMNHVTPTLYNWTPEVSDTSSVQRNGDTLL
jgi:hypothetical protein